MLSATSILNRRKAVEIIARSSGAVGLSQAHRSILEDSIEHDLNVESEHAADSEEGLRHIEDLTRALADDVFAFGLSSEALDAAIEVIKEKL